MNSSYFKRLSAVLAIACTALIVTVYSPDTRAEGDDFCAGALGADLEDAMNHAYWENAIQQNYKLDSEKWFLDSQYIFDGFFQVRVQRLTEGAIALDELYQKNDHHARTLKNFGFTRVRNNPKSENWGWVPPEDFRTVISAYRASLDKHLQQGTIKPDEALNIGFVFIKKDRHEASNNFKDYVVIKYGDKYPSPRDYKLVGELKSPQLPDHIFDEVITRGVFPFPASNFSLHEYGHLTEMAEYPGIMRELKRFSSSDLSKTVRPKLTPDEAIKDWFYYRKLATLEFFSLPNIQHTAEIRALLQKAPWITKAKTINEVVTHIKNNLPKNRQLEYASQFARAAEKFIYRQGGAMRDTYNFKIHMGTIESHVGIFAYAPEVTPKVGHEYSHASNESLLGMIHNIQYIKKLFDGGSEYTFYRDLAYKNWIHWIGYNFVGSDEDLKTHLLNVALENLAQLQMALYIGTELQITPEDIWNDSMRSRAPVDPNSKTGQYLHSFILRHNWFTKNAFGI